MAEIGRGPVLTGDPITYFVPPNPEQWKDLEDAFGKPLPETLRELLNHLTAHYVAFASRYSSTQPRSEVARRLERWRKETLALRQYVWIEPKDSDQHKTKKTGTAINPNLPLYSFARMLDQAVSSVDQVLDALKKLPSNKRHQTFAVWVVLVRLFFEAHELATTASSHDKLPDDSPFVKFMEKYQWYLGKEHPHYAASTLAKYINNWSAELGGQSLSSLVTTLVFCGLAIQSEPSKNDAATLGGDWSLEEIQRIMANKPSAIRRDKSKSGKNSAE